MDVAKAFTYVIEDEGWMRKLGIGALISLLSFLIVPIPLLIGYLVGITRNVKDGMDKPLPEWDDLGTLFRDGLSVMVAQFVYTLPFIILTCIAVVATGGLGAIAEGGGSEELFAAGMAATLGLISCLGLIFAIALLFISPAIVIQYVNNNELSACFRFSEVFSIARNNAGDILIAALALFGASLLLSVINGVLLVIPCLGWIAAIVVGILSGPYMTAITGHMYGQIAAKADGNKMNKFDSGIDDF